MLPSHLALRIARSKSRKALLAPLFSKFFATFFIVSACITATAGAQGSQGATSSGLGGMSPNSINPNAGSGITSPIDPSVLVSANATHTYTFTLTDTSSHSASVTNTIFACSGSVSNCSVSPGSVSIGAGFSHSVTVTYHTAASGTGTVEVQTHWPSQLNTYGTLSVRLPSAPPVVTAPATAQAPEDTSFTDSDFSIKNNGTATVQYALRTEHSGAGVTNSWVATPTASVAPGNSVAATVSYVTGPFLAGNGTITLWAKSPFGDSSSTTVTVTPMSAKVTVTPIFGTDTLSPGATDTVVFTVHDDGNESPVTYGLACDVQESVSSCTVLESSSDSIQVYSGSPRTVRVGYHANPSLAGGSGAVTLTATSPGAHSYSDRGYYTVTVPDTRTYTVAVSPTQSADSDVYTAENVFTNHRFIVRNNGNTSATYSFTSPECSGGETGCAPRDSSKTIGAGDMDSVYVDFTSGTAPNTGHVELVATGLSNSSTGRIHVIPLSEAVSVAAAEGRDTIANGLAQSLGFGVSAVGNNTSFITYTLNTSCSGAVTCPANPNPDTVRIKPGSPLSSNVTATATDDLAGGTGLVILTASYTNEWGQVYQSSDTTTITVPDMRSDSVVVTPENDTTYNEANVPTNFTFHVRNAGNNNATYTVSTPTCTGTASGCSFGSAGNTVTVNAGQTGSVTVYFETLGPGQNVTIHLHATATTPNGKMYSDDGSILDVTLAPTVAVTPVTSSETAVTNSSGTYRFHVHNEGTSGQITYTLQVTGCTAPLSNCTAPDSVTVAQGADSIITVSFATLSPGGTGQISLRAYKNFFNTYESTGTGLVTVNTRLGLSTSFMNNDYQDVGLCAASCFAMTAARSTVPYYTLDTPRSITLAYNGDRAFPRPFVYADVYVQSAPAAVDYYTLEVKRNGGYLTFVNGETKLIFAGTTNPAATYRLAGQLNMSSDSTGVDTVTVQVTAHYINSESDVSSVKTRLMIVNSTLNADAAPVAKGWTIAGLQHLRATPEGPGTSGLPGGGYMIENGDGSATYFYGTYGRAEDYSTLTFDSVATWTRTYLDGSRVLFDLAGRMTAAIDRLGRKTEFHYGGLDSMQLVSVIEPMRSGGHSTSAPYLKLSYDSNHYLSSIAEMGGANGRTTGVTVDGNGHLTRITDPDNGYDSYGYDTSGRLHTITDRRGNTTTYKYGDDWKLSEIDSPSVPIDNGDGTTTPGTPTVTVVPWQSVGVPYDLTASDTAALLKPDTVRARITDANGNTSIFYPNRVGEALKTIDPLGNVTTMGYQDFILTTVMHPDSSVDSASYNQSSGLRTGQRRSGQKWITYTYGNKNQLSTVSGDGVVSVTNTLDSLGRVVKTQNGTAAGDTTVYTYDSVTMNVASAVQPFVGRTAYGYDPRFGNTQTDTAPGGRVTLNYFDAYGRDTASKAPQHPMTKTVYDILNRVTKSYASVNRDPVTIKYDAILPVSVRDPLNNVDSTEYDALGRAKRHFAYASPAVPTTVRYDLGGRPTSATNRRGQRVDVTYDALGRVLSKSGDNTTTDVFTYSANGLIGTATNATASIRTVSSPSARVDTVQTTMTATGVAGYTYTVVHHYSNSASGTDSVTISSSGGANGAPAQFVTRRYVNDGGTGTLTGIDLGTSGGTSLGASTFGNSTLGWRDATTWPTGANSSSSYFSTGTRTTRSFSPSNGNLNAAFFDQYAVDSAGRILRTRRHDGDPNSYTQRLYGYDDLGRWAGSTDISAVSWNCGGSGSFDPDYGYLGCPIDSLIAPSYETYDDAGNPNASWFARGTADQLSTAGMSSMTYDADGNVATHTFGGSGITERDYRWSAENRLTAAVIGNDSVTFDYDPLGRPVVRRGFGSGLAGEGMRVTLYDGSSILADLDSAGNRIAEYVYDEGTDRPYAMLTGATTVTGAQYFVMDEMGNVEGTFMNSATVVQYVRYDDLGLPTVLGDTTNRLTWKGLSYDKDVMLTYMRARWYDPMVGRFVSEDPLGLAGGINPYVFANNDAINGFDPSGMSECIIIKLPADRVCQGKGPTAYCTEDGAEETLVCFGSNSGGVRIPTMAPTDGVLVVHRGGGGGSTTTTSPNADACANSTLTAAGVDIRARLATVNAAIQSADMARGSYSIGLNPIGAVAAELGSFSNLVHTGGPYDDKNQPGPGTPQQRIDAGNISYGVTCSFGNYFCQFAAGVAQSTIGGGPDFSGTLLTGFDTPSDNLSIREGQAMRAAGCR